MQPDTAEARALVAARAHLTFLYLVDQKRYLHTLGHHMLAAEAIYHASCDSAEPVPLLLMRGDGAVRLLLHDARA